MSRQSKVPLKSHLSHPPLDHEPLAPRLQYRLLHLALLARDDPVHPKLLPTPRPVPNLRRHRPSFPTSLRLPQWRHPRSTLLSRNELQLVEPALVSSRIQLQWRHRGTHRATPLPTTSQTRRPWVLQAASPKKDQIRPNGRDRPLVLHQRRLPLPPRARTAAAVSSPAPVTDLVAHGRVKIGIAKIKNATSSARRAEKRTNLLVRPHPPNRMPTSVSAKSKRISCRRDTTSSPRKPRMMIDVVLPAPARAGRQTKNGRIVKLGSVMQSVKRRRLCGIPLPVPRKPSQ